METTPSRSKLLRPLYTAVLLYLLAGAVETGLIFAKSQGVISPDQIAIGKKVVVLFSTLSTVILLRWLVADTPFAFLRKYTAAPLIKTITTLLIYFGAGMTLLNQLVGINIKPLLTGSAVLTGVLALSLQETIKNLFTGLWINTERIVAKGDWIKIADREGQVMDVTWSTTRLLTKEDDCIYLPNRMLAEGALENYTHPTSLHVVEVVVGAGYRHPPNKVKRILMDVASNTDSVLKKPEPEILILNYGDSSINYRVRVCVDDYQKVSPIKSDLYSKIWYAFRREQVEIPFPVRTIYYKQEENVLTEDGIASSIRGIDFLKPLKEDQLKTVAAHAKIELFGAGETIVRQGEHGDTCYFIQSGSVDIVLRDEGGDERFIASLKSGDFFGEMSLLAGEPRKATVIAKEDCSCIVISSKAFHTIFDETPELAESLSELLAKRYSELEEAHKALSESEKVEARKAAKSSILGKIRSFFKVKER